jgi:hypothetical protein
MTDDAKQLIVESHFELSALHKAIHEAKFIDAVENPVWTSPFVAAVANRLVETMISMDAGTPVLRSAKEWRAWRMADQSRFEWKVCLDRAHAIDKWGEWDDTKKREVAALLFSPLQLTEQKMTEFLAECDSAESPHSV